MAKGTITPDIQEMKDLITMFTTINGHKPSHEEFALFKSEYEAYASDPNSDEWLPKE